MAGALANFIANKSSQENITTLVEILEQSKKQTDNTAVTASMLIAMGHEMEARDAETDQQNQMILYTFDQIGYAIEIMKDEMYEVLDDIRKEDKEQSDKLIEVISAPDAGALVAVEPNQEVQQNALIAEVHKVGELIATGNQQTVNALTIIGDQTSNIQEQTAEIIENEEENKIKSLIKTSDAPVKENVKKEEEKKGGFDMKKFMSGITPMLKKFLSPVTWILALIQQVLPWVLIFGAMFIGFWKTASTKVKTYAIGILLGILGLWRLLTGKILKDFRLAFKVMKTVWNGVMWVAKTLHIKEHAIKLKNLAVEKALALKTFTLKKVAIAKKWLLEKKTILFEKGLALKTFVLKKAIALKTFVIEKALALKKWALDVVHHVARMFTTTTESAMNTTTFTARIANVVKEAAQSLTVFVSKIANIVAEKAMALAAHVAELAKIAFSYACEIAKFVKDMVVVGLKLIHAIALFIADMARVIFQIAATMMQYLLIAAAIILVVALFAGLIYLMVKVLMKVLPMIMEAITSVIMTVVNVIKEILSVVMDFLAPIGEKILDVLVGVAELLLMPGKWIFSLIKGVVGFIKDLFTGDDEDEANEEKKEAKRSEGDWQTYTETEQIKMDLFNSRMDQVLKQFRVLTAAVTVGAIASKVTAKFFGVNPSSGQPMPAGTSQFAQVANTDGRNVDDQITRPETLIDYSEVLKDIKKLLQDIKDKKEPTVDKDGKPTGFFGTIFG